MSNSDFEVIILGDKCKWEALDVGLHVYLVDLATYHLNH